MTHQYAKPTRKKLHELAGLAHERELSRALGKRFTCLQSGQAGFFVQVWNRQLQRVYSFFVYVFVS